MDNTSEHNPHLTPEEAKAFFSEFYFGDHHIPGKIKEFGYGFMVNHDRGDLSTYDYDQLTRLVLMAHDKCYRVSVMPSSPRHVKIAIWKRQSREGGMSVRHPDIHHAIDQFNKRKEEAANA